MTAISWNTTELSRNGNSLAVDIRGKWVNSPYLTQGQVTWSPIINEFQSEGNGFALGNSPWGITCPKLATGNFVLANQQSYDVHGKSPINRDSQEIILSNPDASPVSGQIDPAEPSQCVYYDALGAGIDIRISHFQGRGCRAEHLIVFRQEPSGGSPSVSIDTDVQVPNSNLPNLSGSYDISNGLSLSLRNGPNRAGITIRPSVAWYYDATGQMVVTPVTHTLLKQGQKLTLRKTIPRSLITTAINARPGGELRVDASSTFYPDADAETTSVDGYVVHQNVSGDTWANIRDGAGTSGFASTSNLYAGQIFSSSSTDTWRNIIRSIYLFDTSSLGAGTSVTSATLSVYGQNKADNLSCSPTFAVYSSSPASNTDIVAGDFDSLGTTEYSSSISYSGWSTSGYNDFTLNASGRAAIDVVGVSKFGSREETYDAFDWPPDWSSLKASFASGYSADNGGTSLDPKLVVTYPGASGGHRNPIRGPMSLKNSLGV